VRTGHDHRRSAQAVAPGEVIGIDLRDEAVTQARLVARERGSRT